MIGALTADPSGRLLAGCGAWLDAFVLLDTGGASEVCEQAASEAASNRADSTLERDIIVIFLEMEAIKLFECQQSCRDLTLRQPSICGCRGAMSTGEVFVQQVVLSSAISSLRHRRFWHGNAGI